MRRRAQKIEDGREALIRMMQQQVFVPDHAKHVAAANQPFRNARNERRIFVFVAVCQFVNRR